MLLNTNICFKKNLLFFKHKMPKVYEKFYNFIPQKVKLFIDKNEELNFLYNDFKGHKYIAYSENPKEFCKQQAQNFINNPHKIKIAPSVSSRVDFILYNFIKTISSLKNEKAKETYFEKSCIPLLIVIGVGLGYHIEYLIRDLNIKHLIIFEPDEEIFYLSLYTIDWENIFEQLGKNNVTLFIHLGNKDINININVNNILNNIKQINPIFINNSSIYRHFNFNVNPLLEKLIFLTRGFGFYEDEKSSLENTILNIKNKIPLYSLTLGRSKREMTDDSIAFVIAAGPSLDNSIKIIKKYEKKAIIFSCGTTIRTLEKEGILPDFHIELERKYATFEALGIINKQFLKKLSIIGNNTVRPDVYSLFGESFMFLKPNDIGSNFFSENIPRLFYCNPTVTNSALALTLELGFKNIYLFGADMGFRHAEYHHSKNNVSMYKNSRLFCGEMKPEKQVEGNFGGQIYTSDIFLDTKYRLELLLSRYSDINVYNCSDGAKILKTIPLKTENLNLDDIDFNKKEIKETIKSQFTFDYLENMDINKILNEMHNELLEKINNLIEMINEKITDKLEILDIFYNMYQYIKSTPLIVGSVLDLQFIIYSYAFAEEDETLAVEFINKSFSVFRDFLFELKKDIKGIFLDSKF